MLVNRVGKIVFFLLKSSSGFHCGFFLSLRFFDVVDCALNRGIAALKNRTSLLLGVGYDLSSLVAKVFGIRLISLYDLVKSFFFDFDFGAFVFPISFVAGDVEQVFVEVDIVRADDFFSLIDD